MGTYISRARASIVIFLASLVLPLLLPNCYSPSVLIASAQIPELSDADLLEFPLNLEYLEAEFFLFRAFGYGLDVAAPNLTGGGPPPIGAKKVELDSLAKDVILQFAFQEVGHLRAIKSKVTGFPRPLLDLSSASFAKLMDSAVEKPLEGLLGVESGQDAVLRELLYECKVQLVAQYKVTVAEFTNRISIHRSKLGNMGMKDEGIIVPKELGAESRVRGNILAGDDDSLAYSRTPEEILRIVYGSDHEDVCGGFYPNGASGLI
ncbi:Desiccation-related protein PCC13-62 [Glycine soja]|uniref:Desiccation-related protein PCC13-62 n=1 Tax=Glycine soja TaxID=3848 RepID=A0A445GT84_GLYSO|nr:Desiccation-related protein PCC13-62 [Glycine soja]